MATPKTSYFLYALAALFLALSFNINTISTSVASDHGGKSLHFVLYQHETFNKTSYLITNGVTGPGITPTTSPFGALLALQDDLTITPDSSSQVAGTNEGFTITTSFDGLVNTAVCKFTVQYEQYNGTISVVGSANNLKPSDVPVVGGTGDFLFVQGYVTSSPVVINGFTFTYKVEFHLYWPPYLNKMI